jgi:hypothetical protein
MIQTELTLGHRTLIITQMNGDHLQMTGHITLMEYSYYPFKGTTVTLAGLLQSGQTTNRTSWFWDNRFKW